MDVLFDSGFWTVVSFVLLFCFIGALFRNAALRDRVRSRNDTIDHLTALNKSMSEKVVDFTLDHRTDDQDSDINRRDHLTVLE